eukprot:PhM_4_TR10426/c1_g1_i1/m.59191
MEPPAKCSESAAATNEELFAKFIHEENSARRAVELAYGIEWKVVDDMFLEGLVILNPPAPEDPPDVVAGTWLGEYEAMLHSHVAATSNLFEVFYQERRALTQSLLGRRVSGIRVRAVDDAEGHGRRRVDAEEAVERSVLSELWLSSLRTNMHSLVASESVQRVEVQLSALQMLNELHAVLHRRARGVRDEMGVRAEWAREMFAIDRRARERITCREYEERLELWTLFRVRYWEAAWEGNVSMLYNGFRDGYAEIVLEEEREWRGLSLDDDFEIGRTRIMERRQRQQDKYESEEAALKIWRRVSELCTEEVRARARIDDEESVHCPKPPWRRKIRLVEAVLESRGM